MFIIIEIVYTKIKHKDFKFETSFPWGGNFYVIF